MSTRPTTDLDAADNLSFREDFDPVSTEQWVELIESDLRGRSIDRLTWQSIEGVSLRPFYRSEDLDSFDHLASDPLPLVSRGRLRETPGERTPSNPVMEDERSEPGNPWQIRQEIIDSTPKEAGPRIQSAVEGGAESIGLQIATGRDRSRGCHIPTPDALVDLLRDADLEGIPLHLDGSAWAIAFLPAVLRMAEDKNHPADAGSIAFDPISALLQGEAAPPAPLFDLASDAIQTVHQANRNVRTMNVDLRPFHEAGASAVQELAYAAGCLTEQLSILTEKGHRLTDLVRTLFVSVPVGTTYFLEIGKLRALRLLLTRVIQAFGEEAGIAEVADVHPSDLVVHAHTSRRSETVYGPHVNLLRGSTEAAAAVLGGCDVVSVAPFDTVRSGVSELSTRLARNTPLMLRHESHLDQVADPGAGSYYIEAATDALSQAAWALFQDIEAKGGLLASLSDGWLHDAIAEVREQRLDRLDTRQHVLVGTTHYPDVDDEGDDIEPDSGFQASRISSEASSDSYARHSSSPPATSRDANSQDASADEHSTGEHPIGEHPIGEHPIGEHPTGEHFTATFDSVSSLEDALQSGRPLEEIARWFRSGTRAVAPLPQIRLAEPFERLRRATENKGREGKRRPTVLLAPIGPAGPRSARATFARNMLGVAGFRIIEPLAFDNAQDAARHAADSGADVIVLCSADDQYDDLLARMHEAISEHDLQVIVGVAGAPDAVAPDHDTPPAFFVHRHAPLLETLRSIQSLLGIEVDASARGAAGSG